MLENDTILENPLKVMGFKTNEMMPKGGCGAILARAGVGKTSFLVQLALNTMLRNENVLHISLEDHVSKISLWYQEVFSNLARQHSITDINSLWEAILPHRLIMTFKVDSFSVPRFEERLADLIEQKIFSPNVIFIDGLNFSTDLGEVLTDLKHIAKKLELNVWFTVRTHRHEEPGPDGTPVQLAGIMDLFDVAIMLQPEGKDIHVKSLKGGDASEKAGLLMDPATMLLREAG
jgi:hypothetical protein